MSLAPFDKCKRSKSKLYTSYNSEVFWIDRALNNGLDIEYFLRPSGIFTILAGVLPIYCNEVLDIERHRKSIC